MRGFKNADRYYDSVLEREERNAWWRVSLRYLISVCTFLALIWSTLYGYWTFEDYSRHGAIVFSWENMVRRAETRWEDLKIGRIGL